MLFRNIKGKATNFPPNKRASFHEFLDKKKRNLVVTPPRLEASIDLTAKACLSVAYDADARMYGRWIGKTSPNCSDRCK